MLGDTITESTRTFAHKPFKLDQHIKRLYKSLKVTRINPGMTAGEMLQVSLNVLETNLAQLAPDEDVWLVHNISRGRSVAGADPTVQRSPATVIIFTQSMILTDWAPFYLEGCHAVTPMSRAMPAQALDARIKNRSRMAYTLGEIEVPASARWGAQTQRAIENYPISGYRAFPAFIRAFVRIKRAAALGKKTAALNDACARARRLLRDGYRPALRPSQHEISRYFQRDNGGAIPPRQRRWRRKEASFACRREARTASARDANAPMLRRGRVCSELAMGSDAEGELPDPEHRDERRADLALGTRGDDGFVDDPVELAPAPVLPGVRPRIEGYLDLRLSGSRRGVSRSARDAAAGVGLVIRADY